MIDQLNTYPMRLIDRMPSWPPVAAFAIGLALLFSSMSETLDISLPDIWPAPKPDITDVSYAPAPGRDDRTPVAFMSQVFGLNDASLPSKLSGIGPVYWKHSGRGTGALIAPDVVLTTAHLFVANGDWKGAAGAVPIPPAPSDGFIFLPACGERYRFTKIEVGSEAPRARLGLDYAIAVLERPACDEAAILPVAETPKSLASMNRNEAIILNTGSYAFANLPRYAKHPIFTARKARGDGMHKQAVFGVLCKVTSGQDTGDVARGSTGIIITEGCDGVPGGSGGPLLLSQDGGANYAIIGVANSYRPNTEYNNYTRIEGAFAAHIETFFARFGGYAVSQSSRLQTRGQDDV